MRHRRLATGRVVSRRGATYPVDYEYDDWGDRVAMATYSDDTPSIFCAYDRSGNIVSAVTDGVATNLYAYSSEGLVTNEVQNGASLARSYDSLGRPAGYTLTTPSKPSREVSCSYDSLGRLFTVASGTNVFTYSYLLGSDLVSGYTCGGFSRPLACSLAIPQSLNSSTFFYALDGNKNVTELVDADGKIAAHYEYSAFGKTLLSLSADGHTDSLNPWRFSSEYAEDATRLVYYNYRHHEPITGRWLLRDPLEENEHPNLVVYVLNSPLSKVDYLGQRISMEKCNQLLDSLWDFTPSNIDIDIMSMGINITALGCKNPKPTCVCTIERKYGSFHPANNSIELNAYNLTVSEFRGTLLHELQHRYDSCMAGGNDPEDCHERARWEVNAVLRSGRCKSAANSTTDWDCVKKRAKGSVDKHPNCAATSSAEIDAYIKKLQLRGWL